MTEILRDHQEFERLMVDLNHISQLVHYLINVYRDEIQGLEELENLKRS